MKTTINQRFNEIAKMFFDGNISKMARAVGVSQPALRDIMSERATTPGYQTLKAIVDCTTININPAWLLTGEGAMINGEKKDESGSTIYDQKLVEEVRELKEEVTFLKGTISGMLKMAGMSSPEVKNEKGKSA